MDVNEIFLNSEFVIKIAVYKEKNTKTKKGLTTIYNSQYPSIPLFPPFKVHCIIHSHSLRALLT